MPRRTALLALLLLCGGHASAATFDELAGGTLDNAQLKLTYLGPQNKPIPTLVVTVDGREIDWAAFTPWQEAEHRNDRLFQEYQGRTPSFSVSSQEMRAAVRGLGGRASREDATAEPAPFLSCMVTAGAPGAAQGVDVRLSARAAAEWFVLLRNAFRADPKDVQLLEGRAHLEAIQTLQWWGCALGLLSHAIPARDASAQIEVTTGGLRWNPTTRRFECSATLRNRSDQPVKGPVALVVYPSTNVSLANAHGVTCVTTPSGRGFLNVPMPAQMLAPTQALETVLEFEHEEGAGLSFTTKVLAGVGER